MTQTQLTSGNAQFPQSPQQNCTKSRTILAITIVDQKKWNALEREEKIWNESGRRVSGMLLSFNYKLIVLMFSICQSFLLRNVVKYIPPIVERWSRRETILLYQRRIFHPVHHVEIAHFIIRCCSENQYQRGQLNAYFQRHNGGGGS